MDLIDEDNMTLIDIGELYDGVGSDIKTSLTTIFKEVCAELEHNLPPKKNVPQDASNKQNIAHLIPQAQELEDGLNAIMNRFSNAPENPEEFVRNYKIGEAADRDMIASQYTANYFKMKKAVNTVLERRGIHFRVL